MKIGIIGAGAAGLAAAYDLANAGHELIVYESAPFAGGQASTIEVGGARLERGYHHLFLSDRSIIGLMEELGVGSSLQWIPSTVSTYTGGKMYPFVTPFDLLRFKPLSPLDRIRLGLLSLRLQRMKDWRPLQHLTAAEWIKSEGSDGIFQNMWDPLLRAKFGRHHDVVGMPWLWSKFQTRVTSRKGMFGREVLGYPVTSFDEVFQELQARIESKGGQVHLSSQVRQIHHNEAGATGLRVEPDSGEPFDQEFDSVLATNASFDFVKLVDLPDDYRSKLEDVHYMAAVVLILEMKHPLTSTYWMNIADDSVPFLGLIEHTNLMPKEMYGGNHVLYLTNYLDRDEPMFSMSKEELLAHYLPHLKKFNPEFDESWITKVHYNALSAAQPIITPNYAERIPSHRTPIKNLYLANTTQIYPEDRGTNYSIRMGREMAQMIIGDRESTS
ncbi:MAG: NAD(P)/FAD-dependent oxidoreductase [Chloroflexi bacterium]|nr:NAD(P)/FAD-dependent oxidoreductase [Chloroflexota bacterium]